MPTTVKAGFISTILSAGYHVKLAVWIPKAGFASTVLSAGYHVKLAVWIPDKNQDNSVTHPHTILCYTDIPLGTGSVKMP